MVFVVVLLAMVAGFLALRLYAVLGKRTGHEQSLPPRGAPEQRSAPPVPRTADAEPQARDTGPTLAEDDAADGLRRLIAADPQFDLVQFVDGAKSAYRMILEAFWTGDAETLDWLTEPEVNAAFKAAIAERTEAGHRLDNRLVSIERAVVSDVALDGRVARITVRFDADIAAVTRDADGTIVAGSTSDAVETHDVWTFARTLGSDDPNWKLADTDEA